MIDLLAGWIVPGALGILPEHMRSPDAIRFLVAIAWQESRGMHRRQLEGGPARGYWMFEVAGVSGVLTHHKSSAHAEAMLTRLCYSVRTPYGVQSALEHNDTLAAGFARLLVWTLPNPLPKTEADAWAQYLAAWRPGKPHPQTWAQAWAVAMKAYTLLEGDTTS